MYKKTVTQKRNYLVQNTKHAIEISDIFLKSKLTPEKFKYISYGLPEVDDRYHIWRVPICDLNQNRIGEVAIDAFTGKINLDKSSKLTVININNFGQPTKKKNKKTKKNIELSSLKNTLITGDSRFVLKDLPSESINLVFTSPPYYNAKPEYSEYSTYEEYLDFMRSIIKETHRVLSEGRFFVINVSPVLIRRASRNEASKRLAVPFDLHCIFIEEGFEFIDDIHWVKPEGAGWAFGRGRRFAADRNPLQYKPVPVTEYILVYRKKTDRLIDWNIRNHPDKQAVENSKVPDGYEKTNIWKINPVRNKNHPAPFPLELAEKVIRYYSFKDDVVLDPFAGSGTTGFAALSLNRRFVLIEMDKKFSNYILNSISMMLDNLEYIES